MASWKSFQASSTDALSIDNQSIALMDFLFCISPFDNSGRYLGTCEPSVLEADENMVTGYN